MILCPLNGNWCGKYRFAGLELNCAGCDLFDAMHKPVVCKSCGKEISGGGNGSQDAVYPGGVCFDCFRRWDP